MKTDKLDIKIKEAADHYEPAYDEAAWSKMEKLLDKNMPINKPNKRRMIWLFLLLMFIAGSLLFIGNFRKSSNKENITLKENTRNSSFAPAEGGPINSKNEKKSVPPANEKKIVPSGNEKRSASSTGNKLKTSSPTLSEATYPAGLPKKHPSNNKSDAHRSGNDQEVHAEGQIAVTNNYSPENNRKPENGVSRVGDYETQNRQISKNEDTATSKPKSLPREQNMNKEESDTVLKPATTKKVRSSKKENKFRKSFSVSFSLGPDVSAIHLNNAGKIEPAFGLGISYAFASKWSIKSGIFFEKKVYEAAPSDYHAPARFTNYFPDLKNISADCELIELPLVVSYYFSASPTYSWLASAGISSFLMKTEDYDYLSKNASGQSSYYNYVIHNKNEHFLSSIRLSAGYQKKLSNNFSIVAEPYFNVPLSGIGYGKVNLYSAGVLFTLSIKPFARK